MDAAIDIASCGLYVVSDRKATRGRSLSEVIEAALSGGAQAFQLREKDLSGRELFDLGKSLLLRIRSQGGLLLINDRVDIAMALGADGVHLGQGGLSPVDARRLMGEGKVIGVSTHSLDEAQRAEIEGADFITLGPIFYTPSKASYGEPLGSQIISQVASSLSLPVLAIGGVNKENLAIPLRMGACGIAVISAVMGDEDPQRAVQDLLRAVAAQKAV